MKIINPIGRIIEDETADYEIGPYACAGTTAAKQQANCSSCGCGCPDDGIVSTNMSSGVRTGASRF